MGLSFLCHSNGWGPPYWQLPSALPAPPAHTLLSRDRRGLCVKTWHSTKTSSHPEPESLGARLSPAAAGTNPSAGIQEQSQPEFVISAHSHLHCPSLQQAPPGTAFHWITQSTFQSCSDVGCCTLGREPRVWTQFTPLAINLNLLLVYRSAPCCW